MDSHEERERIREWMRRREAAYAFMEEERRERVRNTRFAEICHHSDGALAIALQKPQPTTSGLVEMYKILLAKHPR